MKKKTKINEEVEKSINSLREGIHELTQQLIAKNNKLFAKEIEIFNLEDEAVKLRKKIFDIKCDRIALFSIACGLIIALILK